MLGKAIGLWDWTSPWQRTCPCRIPPPRAFFGVVSPYAAQVFHRSLKGELLQIPFLVGETDRRKSCWSRTEEGKCSLPRSRTPVYSATALLGLNNSRKQNKRIEFPDGGKQQSALLESCRRAVKA